MFIGHFAAGFALKKAAPRVSLGMLFFAAQFVDLLWPTLLLAGVERAEIVAGSAGPPLRFSHYPYSHSLLMAAAWAVAIGWCFSAFRRDRGGALACGAGVLSHWFLDLLVHHPDLPLLPGGTAHLGFGLWSSLPASLALELTLLGAGVWLYCRATSAVDSIGKWGLWALVAFLLAVHVGNVFGAPPPSITAVAWVGQAQWLLVLWGWWIDRHRRAG